MMRKIVLYIETSRGALQHINRLSLTSFTDQYIRVKILSISSRNFIIYHDTAKPKHRKPHQRITKTSFTLYNNGFHTFLCFCFLKSVQPRFFFESLKKKKRKNPTKIWIFWYHSVHKDGKITVEIWSGSVPRKPNPGIIGVWVSYIFCPSHPSYCVIH